MALTCSIKDLSFSKAFPTVVMVETETTMANHKGPRDSVCFEGEDVGAKVGEQDWAVTADYYTLMAACNWKRGQ